METPSLAERKVICPHCWHRFYADQAKFISRHAQLFGDAVLGEAENIRYSAEEISRDRDGAALDPKGWKMTDRACPRCHLQIPADLLRDRPIFVSIVGASGAGKTYLLTSMIHRLRRELAQFFHFSLVDADSHDVQLFLDYERTLFHAPDPTRSTFLKKTHERGEWYNTVRLDGVDVLLPKPFIFSIRPTAANVDASKHGTALNRDLVLYDNAGESFGFLKEKYGNDRVTQHLAESEAILFVFDPLQDPLARRKLSAYSRDPQLAPNAMTHRQDAVLAETINRLRRHRNVPPGQRLPSKLVVCVQKYDVWRPLLAHAVDGTAQLSVPRVGPPIAAPQGGELIDHTSVEYDVAQGAGRFDVDEVNRISLLVRSFIEELNPEFVALAEANFDIIRYFPVSALGTSPHVEAPSQSNAGGHDWLKVKPLDIHPFRVTHPVLWLLQRQQIIRRVKQDPAARQRYPHATVTPISEFRFRALLPTSNKSVILDREYSGTWIVDPYSGLPVWVPVMGSGGAAQVRHQGNQDVGGGPPGSGVPPEKPIPEKASQNDLSLKLTEQPKPKSRGWFRKE